MSPGGLAGPGPSSSRIAFGPVQFRGPVLPVQGHLASSPVTHSLLEEFIKCLLCSRLCHGQWERAANKTGAGTGTPPTSVPGTHFRWKRQTKNMQKIYFHRGACATQKTIEQNPGRSDSALRKEGGSINQDVENLLS